MILFSKNMSNNSIQTGTPRYFKIIFTIREIDIEFYEQCFSLLWTCWIFHSTNCKEKNGNGINELWIVSLVWSNLVSERRFLLVVLSNNYTYEQRYLPLPTSTTEYRSFFRTPNFVGSNNITVMFLARLNLHRAILFLL